MTQTLLMGSLAALMLALSACGDNNDDVWSGGSGILIGIGVAILLISAILAVRRKNK